MAQVDQSVDHILSCYPVCSGDCKWTPATKQVGHIQIFMDPYLEWQCWKLTKEPTVIMGQHSYAALLFTIDCKPNILETDPGPLDANVS